jgi:hypothetical protein
MGKKVVLGICGKPRRSLEYPTRQDLIDTFEESKGCLGPTTVHGADGGSGELPAGGGIVPAFPGRTTPTIQYHEKTGRKTAYFLALDSPFDGQKGDSKNPWKIAEVVRIPI